VVCLGRRHRARRQDAAHERGFVLRRSAAVRRNFPREPVDAIRGGAAARAGAGQPGAQAHGAAETNHQRHVETPARRRDAEIPRRCAGRGRVAAAGGRAGRGGDGRGQGAARSGTVENGHRRNGKSRREVEGRREKSRAARAGVARGAGGVSGAVEITVEGNERHASQPPARPAGRRPAGQPAADRPARPPAIGESLRDAAAGEGPAEQGAHRAVAGDEPPPGTRAPPAGPQRAAQGFAGGVAGGEDRAGEGG
jgi:hypothetical protein